MAWWKRMLKTPTSPAGPPNTHWALFVKANDGDPTEFFEIRRNGSSVWFAQGKPLTMGESDFREFPSEEDALRLWDGLTGEQTKQGFALVYQGEYEPGTFDFKLLQQAIENGARQAFLRLCEEQRYEKITGFALYSDGMGMTICNAAMSANSFDKNDDELDYYLTNPGEWPYATDVGMLLAYRMILFPGFIGNDLPFEREVPNFVEQFYEAVVRALETLDTEQVFGAGEERNAFLLLFGDSDGGPTKYHVRRLNPLPVFERYADSFDNCA